MNEFDLIRRYFKSPSLVRSDVPLGIGDDCALLQPKLNHQIAVTTDTMVDGVHFDSRLSPYDIGHKLMAVNLSDLASMGAEPCWVSLALTLPSPDKTWLSEFALGLAEMAERYGVSLIGGDTTRGPLTLSLTAQGQLPAGLGLTRSGAKEGDLIFVSGHLGDAALALRQELIAELSKEKQRALEARLFRPTPRVELGLEIRSLASACIDLSDGLSADLGHILECSNLGAELYAEQIPTSEIAKELLGEQGAAKLALAGGDDYELCFSAPEANREAILQAAAKANTPVTCIGQLTKQSGLTICWHQEPVDWQAQGYLHF